MQDNDIDQNLYVTWNYTLDGLQPLTQVLIQYDDNGKRGITKAEYRGDGLFLSTMPLADPQKAPAILAWSPIESAQVLEDAACDALNIFSHVISNITSEIPELSENVHENLKNVIDIALKDAREQGAREEREKMAKAAQEATTQAPVPNVTYAIDPVLSQKILLIEEIFGISAKSESFKKLVEKATKDQEIVLFAGGLDVVDEILHSYRSFLEAQQKETDLFLKHLQNVVSIGDAALEKFIGGAPIPPITD